jgi:DNA-binding GntR family transcriptional regulator
MNARTGDGDNDNSSPPNTKVTKNSTRRHTLSEQVVEAVVARAARGLILPGDRLVEAVIADELKVSRIPVREALRLLESQGLVVSTPYKGVRLSPMTRTRLDQIAEVRIGLEVIAARRAVTHGKNQKADLKPLERKIEKLEQMAKRRDSYGIASADAAFHRELCRLSKNDLLCSVWENVARPLTIIIGLSTFSKSMEEIVEEHRLLLDVLLRGKRSELTRVIEQHILAQHGGLDFEEIIEERHRQREARVREMSRRWRQGSFSSVLRG